MGRRSCAGPELILLLILQSLTGNEIVEQATPSQQVSGRWRTQGVEGGEGYQKVKGHCRVGRQASGEGALEASKRR